MVNTLKTLCALSGVSSFEDEVRNYIIGRVSPYADSLRVDTMGNLIVFKKGTKSTGNKLMLCAHMDEVGLIVKSITDDGYLKFGCVGGIDRRVLLGKRVAIGDKRVTGIIGLKAIHLTTPDNPVAKDQLAFLHLLQTSPALCEEYAMLKMRLAEKYPWDRLGYRTEKGVFIEQCLKEELEEKT